MQHAQAVDAPGKSLGGGCGAEFPGIDDDLHCPAIRELFHGGGIDGVKLREVGEADSSTAISSIA